MNKLKIFESKKINFFIIGVLLIITLVGIFLLIPSVQNNIMNFVGTALKREVPHYDKVLWLMNIAGFLFIFFTICASLIFVDIKNNQARICKNFYQNQKFHEIILYIFFVLFLIFTFVTIFFHEPYRDEIQPWLICKDLSLVGVFNEMRYEGHLMLWNIILYPFAHFGAPLFFLYLISWAINSLTVFYFIKKVPFHFILKIIIICTHPFLYTNPVVSRCYVLIPLLIFLIADIYPKKDEHPIVYGILVALMANTHAYMEGFVAALGIEFLISSIIKKWHEMSPKEKRQKMLALAIGIVGVIFAAAQVLPAFGNSSSAEDSLFGSVIRNYRNYEGIYPFFTTSGFKTVFGALFAVLLLHILLQAIFVKKQIWAIFIFSIFYMIIFSCCIYSANVENRGVLWFYILIFAGWVCFDDIRFINLDKSKSLKLFQVVFAILSLCMIDFYKNFYDFKNEYDSTSSTAQKISETVKEGTPIFVFDSHPSASIVAFLDKKYYPVYDYKSLTQFSYYRWEKNYHGDLTDADFFKKAFDTNIPQDGVLYFLRDFEDEDEFQRFYESLSVFKPSVIFASEDVPYFYFIKLTNQIEAAK